MAKKIQEQYFYEIIADGKSLGFLYERSVRERAATKKEVKRLTGCMGLEVKRYPVAS